MEIVLFYFVNGQVVMRRTWGGHYANGYFCDVQPIVTEYDSNFLTTRLGDCEPDSFLTDNNFIYRALSASQLCR